MLFVGVVAKAPTAEDKLDHLPEDFAVINGARLWYETKIRASRCG
jgi:hypothetical protein